jgi:hypothetical protein
MRYKIVTVSKPTSCCTDRIAKLDEEIEVTCNEMAGRGFVLVTAFDTQEPTGGICCSNCMFGIQTPCWKKAACLVFASP